MPTTKLIQEQKRLRRLVLSEYDIIEAKDICHYILKNGLWNEDGTHEKRLLGRSLQSAMVMAYCRPFSGNSKTEHTLPHPNVDIDKKLSVEQHGLHLDLKRLRHKVFAHTDAEVRDLEVDVASLEGRPSIVTMSIVHEAMFSQKEYILIKSLFDVVEDLFATELKRIESTLTPGDSF
ncbi:hypothetical protein LOS15_07270 [Halomonas sp. 7T]|uniref:hypothetical protein n=1 Tax=Halomonas sp. 7T TaxID=2893469 RepID=UPI0021D8511C|nr:hypothetical protein [Halomonas sp. 7T]UXZ55810.1 hypothetical protein LOS15_07270 [Halomonas sp. 7T]